MSNTRIGARFTSAACDRCRVRTLRFVMFAVVLPGIIANVILTSTPASGQESSPGAASAAAVYEGFTEPLFDILVAASELGRVESIGVQVGDFVAAGQVIGQLDDQLQRKAVELARLQADMTGERDAAAAEVEMNRLRVEKLRQLAAEQVARPDELLRAETDLRIAVGRHVAAVEQSELRQAEYQRYELQLQRRKVLAPMDGVIAQIYHDPGEYITPADPAIARLLVIDRLHAVFSVPVEDSLLMNVGMKVRVFLRSNAKRIEASITSIAPTIDGESGTVQVKVELQNPNHRILSGDRCTLEVIASNRGRRSQMTLKPRVILDTKGSTTKR